MATKTINQITAEQTVFNDTDSFELQEAAGTSKRTFWSSIKAQLKVYFDSIYELAGGGTISYKDDDYVILDSGTDRKIILVGAGSNKTFTLPTLADNQNKSFTLYNNDATYMLTIDCEGSETIDGMTTIQLPKKDNYITVLGTATEWKIIGESIASQLRLNTYAGYGLTDTRIVRFTNVVENIGNLFLENHVSGYSSNAKGLEITINRSGKYAISFTFEGDSVTSTYFGVSLNSNQLTTNYGSITASHSLGKTISIAASGAYTHVVVLHLKKNDVLRPHTGGFIPATTGSGAINFTYLGQ